MRSKWWKLPVLTLLSSSLLSEHTGGCIAWPLAGDGAMQLVIGMSYECKYKAWIKAFKTQDTTSSLSSHAAMTQECCFDMTVSHNRGNLGSWLSGGGNTYWLVSDFTWLRKKLVLSCWNLRFYYCILTYCIQSYPKPLQYDTLGGKGYMYINR